MGAGTFSSATWSSYVTTKNYDTSSTAQIFAQRALAQALDPRGVSVRESRDSADNPQSTAIIIGLDVTGSMGQLADVMARQGLNRLMTEVYDRKPVTDPHVMVMGIGDAECDAAPLQVTQFEADIRIAHQLEQVFLEHGGGGNQHESYTLPWYFAAYHTATDCFEKRGRKGFLFTMGDELPPARLYADDLARSLGYAPPAGRDLTSAGLLAKVSERWQVYHLVVGEGQFARQHGREKVMGAWTALLGQRAIWMPDHRRLAETIVSILQVEAGHDAAAVAASWEPEAAAAVAAAVSGLGRAIDLGVGPQA